MKAGRHKHSIDVAAARHSDLAFALRQLETALNRTAWASVWVDYQIQKQPKGRTKVKTSRRTQDLFHASENTAAQRRRVMKGPGRHDL